MRNAIAALWIFISLFVPTIVVASTYGECNYGEANFGSGCTSSSPQASTSTSSSTSQINATAPSCDDQAPGAVVPWLYGAIPQGSSSVLLYFTPADNPVTKYVLEYGTQIGHYQFGAEDLGINERHQMTYKVQSLSANTTYYFRVRGQNGCAVGNWSNEISATTKGYVSFNQLEFTQTIISPSAQELPRSAVCEPYIVKPGDSLWGIAQKYLDDGNKFTEIIEQNKAEYPSLTQSKSVQPGWKLSINCDTHEKLVKTEDSKAPSGLSVAIKIIDKNEKPISGAKVTLHSTPQEAITDEQGTARFNNVEPGEHRVIVDHREYRGEQSIYLTATENQKEFNINITIEPKKVIFSWQSIVVISALTLIVITLIFLLIRKSQIIRSHN